MATKSCVTCPSYLSDDDSVRSRFGKVIGAPMCGKYGHVLGRPGQPNTEVAVHFALKCDSHGKGMEETPVSISPRVVQPDTSAFKGGTPDELGTCNNCENLVLQGDVMNRFGFPVPLCRAKGTLVLRPMKEARGCPFASAGTPQTSAPHLNLIEELQTGFRVKDEVMLKTLLGTTKWEEPSTYKTDVPVSKEDQDLGIRAWRRYQDDSTGNDYFLPIFNREFFTEEEQSRIPQTGVEFGKTGQPQLYVDHQNLLMSFLKDVYSLDETLCLTGEPGNGKSQFGIYLAWLMQLPFERFAIRPDLNVEDFVGHPAVDPVKGSYFVLGRMPRRLVRPGVVVSDEFNSGNDDINFFYRSLLDTGKIMVDQEGGMGAEKDDYCFHLLTMNPSWDMRNIGTRELADADTSRLSFAWVPEPPEPVMRHILRERCKTDGYTLPEKTLDKIIKIGVDIRELSKQGVYPGSWGLRQEIKIARKTAHYGSLVEAYSRAALDSLDPEIAKIIVEAIESYGT